MIMSLINSSPTWLFFLINVSFFVLFTLVVSLIIAYFFPFLTDRNRNQSTSVLIFINSSIYGVLVGFVIVVLWQNFHTLQDAVSNEASIYSDIMRDSEAFPKLERDKIVNTVQKYVKIVRTEEWPKMRYGKSNPKAWAALIDLFTIIQNYEPQTGTQKTFYAAMVSKANEAVNLRRKRVDALDNILPAPMFFVLVVGALSILFFIAMLQGGKLGRGRHIFMSVTLSAMIGFNLTLIMDLNHPFVGGMSISNAPFYRGAFEEDKWIK